MKKLLAPVVIFITFWVVATLLYQITGNFFFLLNFGYIGTAVGVGTGLYFYPGRKTDGKEAGSTSGGNLYEIAQK